MYIQDFVLIICGCGSHIQSPQLLLQLLLLQLLLLLLHLVEVKVSYTTCILLCLQCKFIEFFLPIEARFTKTENDVDDTGACE